VHFFNYLKYFNLIAFTRKPGYIVISFFKQLLLAGLAGLAGLAYAQPASPACLPT
jgi:hypothetical protein